jgi:hypothetical protein
MENKYATCLSKEIKEERNKHEGTKNKHFFHVTITVRAAQMSKNGD